MNLKEEYTSNQSTVSLKFKSIKNLSSSNINSSKKLIRYNTIKIHKPTPPLKSAEIKSIYNKIESNSDLKDFLQKFKQSTCFSKNSCIEEVNSFSSNFVNEQNLFKTEKMIPTMNKLRILSAEKSIDTNLLADIIYLIINTLQYESENIFTKYKQLLNTCNGFTLKCMVIYFGIYLYMVFSNYSFVYTLLNQLRQLILNNQMYEYLSVYLHIIINIKINLNQHQQAIQYLKKLIKVCWLYEFQEIQIWCYHQMSKSYLILEELELSAMMKNKFEFGILEDKNSKYRAICCDLMLIEIQTIKSARIDFLLKRQDFDLSLIKRKNEQDPILHGDLKHFKHVLYDMAKSRKINHLNTILPKLIQERIRNKDQKQIKTVLYLTHLSRLKNFNLYFRDHCTNESQKEGSRTKFIVIQNSNVNLPILKQILRRIIIEYMV